MRQEGFTLVELVVTIMIAGTLSMVAMPLFMRATENSKAEDAIRIVRMMGAGQRMYRADHDDNPADGPITNACNTYPGCSGDRNGCNVVSCRYVEPMNWDTAPYVVNVGAACGGGIAACVSRRTSGPGSTGRAPYTSWAYAVDYVGIVTPSCTGGSNCPPGVSQ